MRAAGADANGVALADSAVPAGAVCDGQVCVCAVEYCQIFLTAPAVDRFDDPRRECVGFGDTAVKEDGARQLVAVS